MSQAVHRRDVVLADRRHVDQFSVDQFHAVVFPQDAGLGHPVIVVHIQSVPRRHEIRVVHGARSHDRGRPILPHREPLVQR
jgi:hypothetical protein